jgi:transcriptional regulator with XRE-family HTH domain
MPGDDLPILPGFREMAQRRREMLAELVARRRAVGLSQSDVADRMGTSQPAIARLEAGEVDVRMSTVQRYAAALGHRMELRLHPNRNQADPSRNQANPNRNQANPNQAEPRRE